MRLYRASDQLIRKRELIEQALFSRIEDMFSLGTTVTLYDLTNTYFEGDAAANSKAMNGHSKEKRSDCPLVTLGVILDGSGFIRRSKMFEGSVAESTTLEGMLKELNAPKSDDGQEVRLYCYSEGREKKEAAITSRFSQRFETGLTKIRESLTKPQ